MPQNHHSGWGYRAIRRLQCSCKESEILCFTYNIVLHRFENQASMRVLFLFDGSLGKKRSGPAIRCLELARVVAEHHDVALATIGDVELELPPIHMHSNVGRDKRLLKRLLGEHDVV